MLRKYTNCEMKIINLTAIIILTLTLTSVKVEAAGSARDFLKAGTKAVTEKNYALAIRHLTEALGSGNLSPGEVTRALYQRGLAYNAKSEPARGIADFTRALFFKKIKPELRSNILKARANSYRAVGLSSRASADLRVAGLSNSVKSKITIPEKPKLRPVVTQNTFKAKPQPKPQKASKPQFVASGWGASVQEDKTTSQVSRQPNYITRTAKRPVTRSQETRTVEKKSQSAFARLFNREEEKPKSQPKPQVSSSSNWEQTSSNVRTASISNNSVATQLKPAAYTSSGTGRYRLQLAAVSSDNDARQAWIRLKSQHSELLSNQRPDFQKVNLGEGRSVVRIQIGPFADKLQTLQLCNSFKQQGLECFLVVR